MNKKDLRKIKTIELFSNFLERFILQPAFYERSKGVVKERNLQYWGQSKRNKLDFYYKPQSGKYPVVIYTHGGGFLSGRKQTRQYYCYRWAKKGFFAVNIDYDYGVNYPFPDIIRQFFHAVDFVYDNADKYNLDTDNIVLAGESAGAYVSAYAAMINCNRHLFDDLSIPFKHINQFKLKACVLISGVYDAERIFSSGFGLIKPMFSSLTGRPIDEINEFFKSPESNIFDISDKIDSSFPPSIIIQSARDKLAVCSEYFYRKLFDLGVDCAQYVCTKGVCSIHAGGLYVKRGDGKAFLNKSFDFVLNKLQNN